MVVPKATEDTITSLLGEELRKRGVKAEPFRRLSTPVGDRIPDLLCENAGNYLIEAKFSESDLIQAIAKIQNDYIKHHKVLGIHGGFAVLYPEELTRPMPSEVVRELAHKAKFKFIAMFPPAPYDARPFKADEGTIDEIAQKLSEYILTPTKPVEPSIDFIIKSLRESAMYLLSGLKHLAGADLEGFFGGHGVFENVLQYEEGEYPVEELRSAAAYILVNQLLFYHTLSRLRPEFEEIDPDRIERPSDLSEYFSKVLEVNYRPIFFYDVASQVPEKFLEQVKAVINVIKGLSVEKVGGDLLGTIFHDLVPFETRKKVAAFYTNVLAAELLAFLSIDTHDAQVADLAVGSGGLLVAAYRRKRELLKEPFTEAKHRIFVGADLSGVDVMPFAASVAACHLALQSPQYFTNRVRVAIWDSTDLKPGRIIPSAAGLRRVLEGQTYLDSFMPVAERRTKGAVEVGEGEAYNIELTPCDVVIMNPPFTRQERIPEEYKEVLWDRFQDYKDYLHGQLGYYGYFILLADKFLKDDGRMALVLPATVLRVKSCEGIRKFWAEKYHVEHIITTWYRSAFSESVWFREILLVAKKGEASKDAKTTIAVLKKLPTTLGEAREMAEAIKQTREDWEDDRAVVKVHDYSELRSDIGNWFKYIALSDLALTDLAEELLTSDKLVTFKDFLEEFKIETVEGVESRKGGKIQALTISRPERAIKKVDEWVIKEIRRRSLIVENRFTHKVLTIPSSAVFPALRRVSLMNRIDVSDMLDYVVVNKFPKAEDLTMTKFKPTSGFWDRWRTYVGDRIGRLAVVRRADISAPGTCLLAFYSEMPMAPPGVAWSVKVSDGEAKVLSLWFNSTLNILQALLNRKETRGAFLQVDEYVLEEFYVPNTKKLSKDELKSLLETFASVKSVEFSSILDQLEHKHPARKLIDRTWLEVLGYKGDIDKLLDRLYGSLANEIELLKRMMGEGA
jgi:hypothetical protein